MVIMISGVKNLEEIKFCNILLPEYVSFIFYNDNNQVSIDEAKILFSGLNHHIISVGSFKNQSIEEILDVMKLNIIEVILLNGSEDEHYIKELKRRTGLKVIKFSKNSNEADYCIDIFKKENSLIHTNNKPMFLVDYGVKAIANILLKRPYGIYLQYSICENGIKCYYKMENIIKMIRSCE